MNKRSFPNAGFSNQNDVADVIAYLQTLK